MRNNHEVIIDPSKCVGCGLCIEDCLVRDIVLEEGKVTFSGKRCIACGHCQAVCPEAAISMTGYEDSIEDYLEQPRLNPKELMDAIKGRRSVRQFTEETVPADVVEMILEAGRMAPTATNAQATSYVVIENKIEECEELAAITLRKLLKLGKLLRIKQANMKIGDHFFFYGAPLVIVVLGKDKVSASLAAENMAFMAEANGLGVLFSGFFTVCVNLSSKLRALMGVEKKNKAVTTLVIGHPAVKYRRSVHRESLKVTRV